MSPTPLTASLDPKPVSDALDRHMIDVLAKIPSGKTGVLTGAVTTIGAEAGVGVRRRVWKFDASGSGWVGREWGPGRGWLAGVRGSLVF